MSSKPQHTFHTMELLRGGLDSANDFVTHAALLSVVNHINLAQQPIPVTTTFIDDKPPIGQVETAWLEPASPTSPARVMVNIRLATSLDGAALIDKNYELAIGGRFRTGKHAAHPEAQAINACEAVLSTALVENKVK